MAENETKQTTDQFRHAREIYEDYSNNVFMEPSFWDMKLVFGQLNQSSGTAVDQRSAITLPWSQAKILAYLLCGHLLGYELENGSIHIPMSVLPPKLPPPSEEQKLVNPSIEEFYTKMSEIRKQFFGES